MKPQYVKTHRGRKIFKEFWHMQGKWRVAGYAVQSQRFDGLEYATDTLREAKEYIDRI